MARGSLKQDEVEKYRENGFVLVKDLFDHEEVDLLSRSARADKSARSLKNRTPE